MFLAATEELFPVLGATEFFTDMHCVLKIVSTGNVRTLCHSRLHLLERVTFLPGLLKEVISNHTLLSVTYVGMVTEI